MRYRGGGRREALLLQAGGATGIGGSGYWYLDALEEGYLWQPFGNSSCVSFGSLWQPLPTHLRPSLTHVPRLVTHVAVTAFGHASAC